MERPLFEKDEYYYIRNFSVGKEKLFLDEEDWIRFLFTALYFQSSLTLTNLNRYTKRFLENGIFGVKKDVRHKIADTRLVGIVQYCLLPHSFHLIISNHDMNGISSYMQRVQNSYGKYFNTKYGRSGHVFRGPYKMTSIENNDMLLRLSAYVHKLPKQSSKWETTFLEYPWSSAFDFLERNRWGRLLTPDIIKDQFPDPGFYARYVETNLSLQEIEELFSIR